MPKKQAELSFSACSVLVLFAGFNELALSFDRHIAGTGVREDGIAFARLDRCAAVGDGAFSFDHDDRNK